MSFITIFFFCFALLVAAVVWFLYFKPAKLKDIRPLTLLLMNDSKVGSFISLKHPSSGVEFCFTKRSGGGKPSIVLVLTAKEHSVADVIVHLSELIEKTKSASIKVKALDVDSIEIDFGSSVDQAVSISKLFATKYFGFTRWTTFSFSSKNLGTAI